jgi:hypothetical protein
VDTKTELAALFELFGLSAAEAALAARGDSRNPANGTQSSAHLLSDLSEPIGRGGYREF